MHRAGRGFRNKSHKHQVVDKSETNQPGQDHPILQAFRGYRKELDDKHDRNERIVKLSRDITIESKRIIFLLHSIDGRQDNKQKILEEAVQRLQKLIDFNFKAIAKELGNLDPYQFRWAYSPGLQEFIEAYTFMEYMKGEGSSLSDWTALQEKMIFVEKKNQTDKKQKDSGNPADELSIGEEEVKEDIASTLDVTPKKFTFLVDPTEYVLGLSDLTGELMRRCINCLGSGETQICLETCKVLQHFHNGYVGLSVFRCRELSRKIHTMYQSVLKAENVCYNVKVRGGEAAKWGAMNAYDSKHGDEVDEGYF